MANKGETCDQVVILVLKQIVVKWIASYYIIVEDSKAKSKKFKITLILYFEHSVENDSINR